MKSSLLISTAAAIVIAAVSASTAVGGRTVLPGFRSPTTNIRCFVVHKLYCYIGSSNYAASLQTLCMHRDGLDWHGFELGSRTRGRVFCTSNSPYDMGRQQPSNRILQYGRSFHRGSFTCTSRVTGVTCRNANGHGLFVSRQAWRAW
jgi:hypothetical protein